MDADFRFGGAVIGVSCRALISIVVSIRERQGGFVLRLVQQVL